MKKNTIYRREFIQGAGSAFLGLCALGAAASSALAQLRIEVTGVGSRQIPIGIVPFAGQNPAASEMAQIIVGNLARTGEFKFLNADTAARGTNALDVPYWRGLAAEFVVGGDLSFSAGRYEAAFRLVDVVANRDLARQSLAVGVGDVRYAAHKISDIIYEKITGQKGVFASRITYVTKNASTYRLFVADSDGQGAVTALTSRAPIISPAWSPSGSQLAYVSFESGKPVVYVHTVATGQRRVVADFKGSNSAPAWSPDGRNLVLTLSSEGGSQLFVIPAGGGAPRALARSNFIDTEAHWATNGQIYFVSDRGGSPQIYRISPQGGAATRVTFGSNYNISPNVSPDGRTMAFITRVGAGYKVATMDLASSQVQIVSDTASDESPSFSPNGKLILYATRSGGRETLMTTTLDGKVKNQLQGAAGDIREPDWGPYRG